MSTNSSGSSNVPKPPPLPPPPKRPDPWKQILNATKRTQTGSKGTKLLAFLAIAMTLAIGGYLTYAYIYRKKPFEDPTGRKVEVIS